MKLLYITSSIHYIYLLYTIYYIGNITYTYTHIYIYIYAIQYYYEWQITYAESARKYCYLLTLLLCLLHVIMIIYYYLLILYLLYVLVLLSARKYCYDYPPNPRESIIRRSFVYPHRCTLPYQHAQHFQHLCKCVVLRQIAPSARKYCYLLILLLYLLYIMIIIYYYLLILYLLYILVLLSARKYCYEWQITYHYYRYW